MKTLLKTTFICVCALFSLSSCQRGINLEAIQDMKNGPAKDSALLYYYYGLKPGYLVVATDSFYINTQAKSKFSGKKEKITYKGIKDFEMAVDDYRGARVRQGDTLQILGGFHREILKNGKDCDFIQVRLIKNGKTVADGWNWFHISQMALPYTTWTSIFSSDSTERMENILSFIIIALGIIVLYLVWKLIYWIIVKKIRKEICFWQYSKAKTVPFYYLSSVLVGLMYFFIDFSKPLTYALRFNPDFFAHWSEYPLIVKMLPFIGGLWIIMSIAMLFEMIIKYRTLWLIIYYPAKIAIGVLIVSAVILASWLIYIILPSVIAMVAVMFFGKVDDSVGGALSGKGRRRIIGYNNGTPVYEGSGMQVKSQSAGN